MSANKERVLFDDLHAHMSVMALSVLGGFSETDPRHPDMVYRNQDDIGHMREACIVLYDLSLALESDQEGWVKIWQLERIAKYVDFAKPYYYHEGERVLKACAQYVMYLNLYQNDNEGVLY